MGLNCYNVQRIIHWGPPSDIEAYIQETGRGGRNGLHTKAILYNKTSIGLHVFLGQLCSILLYGQLIPETLHYAGQN